MAGRQTYEEAIRLYVETAGDKELGALAAQLTKLGDGSDAAAEQAQALVAELEKLAETSNSIKRFTTLKAEITETGEALDKARARMHALAQEASATDTPTRKLQSSLEAAATKVERLTKAQNRQQAELQKTTGSLRAAGVDTDKLASAYDHLQTRFGDFSRRATGVAGAMQKTAKDSKAAATGVATLDKAAGASAKSLAAIAAKLTVVSGAATAAIQGLATLTGATLFTGALRSAATLEDALLQVRAVSGATADEMVRLKEAAEAGGSSTRFSSLEAAQGLGELARATGSAEAAIAALPATLNLAQAAGLGVAEAAQVITTTLTQYGLAGDQAARVSDVLAKAANTTTADVQGLGLALSYAAPLAKQLGLDTEQTVAVIGALADQGFRGERAGTALRNVFTEMQDPASGFAKALRDLGIESSDFADVIEQLSAKGVRGREALLELDAAARPAILSLVNAGGAGMRQFESDLRAAGGAAEETAKQMGRSASAAEESIRGSLDAARRSLVEPILQPLAEELFTLSNELEEFAQSPEFEQIKVALKELFVEGASAARELLENVDFAQLASDIRAFVVDANGSLSEFTANLGEIVRAVQVVGRGFQFVFNIVQATILGTAAVLTKTVSLIAGWADNLTEPQRKVLEFFGVLEKGEGSLSNLAGGLGAVAEEFRDRFGVQVEEASGALEQLTLAASDAGSEAASSVEGVAKASEHAAEASASLASAARDADGALKGQAQGAVDAAAATSSAAGTMEAGADRLKKAFADLGIESQSNLQRAAESARRNFDMIRAAVGEGQATAEDARRAFAAYAQAARAAAADSDASARIRVEGELRAQQATLGTIGALDELGQAGSRAGDMVTDGANRGASSLSNLGASANSASTGVQKAGEAAQGAGEDAKKGAKGVDQMTHGLMGMSQAAVRALSDLNKFASNQSLWRKQFNETMGEVRRQTAAVDEQAAALEKELAAYDPLSQKLQELQQQYAFVDEAKLRQLAEQQKRLEDERKRVADEKRAASEAASQASSAAASTPQQAVQLAQRAAQDSATAATAVSDLLAQARTAADSISSASVKLQAAGGEVVLRIVSEAAAGAQPLTLDAATISRIASEVLRAIQRSKANST